MPAREHRPHDAVAVHVHAARREALRLRIGVLPRHFVDFRQCCLGRIRTEREAHQRSGHAQHRSPDGVAARRRRDAIERRVDPFVLLRIDRLIRFDVLVTLAVTIGVEHEHRPPLGLLLVLGLVVHACVEPTFDRPTAGEPQHVVVIEVEMVRAEAGVNRRDLLGLRVVHLHLTPALRNRERLGRWMRRARFAEV